MRLRPIVFRMSSNPLAASFSPIPQLDLAAQYAAWREIAKRSSACCSSQQFILGAKALQLEQEIARLCGVAHECTGSGTDALVMALRSVGVAVGDEVILLHSRLSQRAVP